MKLSLKLLILFYSHAYKWKNMNLKKYLKIHWIVELIEFLIFWQGLLLWWKIYQHRHQSCNWLHYQTETQLRTLSRYCLHLLWIFCMFQRVPRCNFERPPEWTIWVGRPGVFQNYTNVRRVTNKNSETYTKNIPGTSPGFLNEFWSRPELDLFNVFST